MKTLNALMMIWTCLITRTNKKIDAYALTLGVVGWRSKISRYPAVVGYRLFFWDRGTGDLSHLSMRPPRPCGHPSRGGEFSGGFMGQGTGDLSHLSTRPPRPCGHPSRGGEFSGGFQTRPYKKVLRTLPLRGNYCSRKLNCLCHKCLPVPIKILW
jgi:hypothetical protein